MIPAIIHLNNITSRPNIIDIMLYSRCVFKTSYLQEHFMAKIHFYMNLFFFFQDAKMSIIFFVFCGLLKVAKVRHTVKKNNNVVKYT